MKASTRKRHVRRDRRKAKASGWARGPKGRRVGHGSHLKVQVGEGLPAKPKAKQPRKTRVVEHGPRPKSPFRALAARKTERGS